MKTIQRLALCFFAVMLLTALFASPVKADQLTSRSWIRRLNRH